MANQNINREELEKARSKRGKLLCVFMFVFFIVFFFLYGFLSKYYGQPSTADAYHIIPLLIMTTLFTVLGFGFLLSSYEKYKVSGLAIAVFVVSFNYLLGPLMQQMWYAAFLSWRNDDVTNAQNFWNTYSSGDITPSDVSFRLSNLCSVSFLIALTGLAGRISLGGVFFTQIFFNIFWYPNLYLNILLSQMVDPKELVYFDDYGTTVVYLFGAIFGIFACNLNKSQSNKDLYNVDKISTVYQLIGSGVLFCTFATVYTDIIELTGTAASFRMNAGAFNIWFSMIASVIGTYIGSICTNDGKPSFRDISIGSVSGAIICGTGAGYIENIGACFAIGLVAGILVSLLVRCFSQRVNQQMIMDSHGFLMPIVIVSFLGSFVVLPAIIIRHYTIEGTYFALGGQAETAWESAGFQLTYVGVTIFIAMIAGLIGGCQLKCAKEEISDFSDSKLFATDYGLYEEEEEKEFPASQSGKNLYPDLDK